MVGNLEVHSCGRRGIRSRLILLLLFVLIPVLLIEAFLYYDRFQSQRAHELQANLEVARAVSRAFEAFVRDVIHQELAIGLAITSSQPMTTKDITRLLGTYTDYGVIRDFSWASPQGVFLYSSNPAMVGANNSDRAYFREIADGREWTVGELVLARTTGKPVFGISRGIRDEKGALLGVVVATVIPEKLDPVLSVERGKGGGLALIDQKGMLVYRYPAINVTWEERNWLKDYPLIEKVLKGEEIATTVYAPYEGKKRLIANTPVSSLGWVAGAGRTEEVALEAATSTLIYNSILFLAVALTAFGIALVFSHRISTSVQRLRDYALALGRGEGRSTAIESDTAEIKDLAEAFSTMAEKVLSRELALRESEELLRVTLTSIGDAVMTTDTDGRITFLNPVASDLTGWKPVEALGQPIKSVFLTINEKTRKPQEDIVGHVLSEGCIVALANHTALLTRDGKEIPVEDSAAPITDSSGKVVGVVLVFRDVTVPRRAQEALKESEERLSLFIEHAPASLAMFDRKMCYLYVSRRWMSDYNLGDRDLRGLSHYDVFPDIPENWKRVHSRAQAGEVVSADRDRFERADGSVQWLRWEVRPWRDAAGEIGGIVVFSQDITESRKADEALRESERRYRELVQNANSAIIRWRRDGTITFFNEYAQVLFGYSADEVIGKHISILVPEKESTGGDLTELVQDIVDHPERYENNINENILRDGSRVWMAWSNKPIFDQDAQVVEILAVGSNITERKQAELALQKVHNEVFNEKQRLEAVMEALPVGLAILDGRGRQIKSNKAFELVWGEPRPAPDSIDDYFAYKAWWADSGRLVQPQEWASARAMRDGETVVGQVMRIARFDGRFAFIHNSASPTRDAHGNIVGSAVAVMDITELKHMEDVLRKSRDELEVRVKERTVALEKANEELRQIPRQLIAVQEEERKRLASELHDSIGQTLAALKFWVETILKFRDAGDLSTSLNYLEQFIPILQRSIEETRCIYMGLRPSMLDNLGLLAALEWLRRQYLKLYPGCHLEFEAGIAEEEIPESLKVNIFRIVQEALNNVAKHSKAEWVDTSLSKTGDGIQLVISDDGVGMELDQILQTSTARSLGFTIMRERAELLGGSFSVDSTPGEGTTIRACWPVEAGDQLQKG